jgi:hypothetical protein
MKLTKNLSTSADKQTQPQAATKPPRGGWLRGGILLLAAFAALPLSGCLTLSYTTENGTTITTRPTPGGGVAIGGSFNDGKQSIGGEIELPLPRGFAK